MCCHLSAFWNVWKFWYAERIEVLNIKQSSSHLFLMTPSKKENRKSKRCVCVVRACVYLYDEAFVIAAATLWYQLVFQATSFLIQLHHWVLTSRRQDWTWSSGLQTETQTPRWPPLTSTTMKFDTHGPSVHGTSFLTSCVSVEEAMELELLDILSIFPSPSDFSSELSESTSPSPLSTKPRACSAWDCRCTSKRTICFLFCFFFLLYNRIRSHLVWKDSDQWTQDRKWII